MHMTKCPSQANVTPRTDFRRGAAMLSTVDEIDPEPHSGVPLS
jgi:hypothetical protein